MIRKISSLFLDKLRLGKPWRYKAPFLIAIPYLFIFLGEMPPKQAGMGLLMSCCTIFGIAGFGYLMNDLSDREEDKRAGKFNLLLELSGLAIVALLLLFLAFAILPWVFYFPKGWSTLGLLGFELLLFLLYSLPPFRFKERGFLGVLCDAGYAHAVPAVLAALTFFYLGNRTFPHLYPLVAALGFWQGLLGIRNILLHQLNDLEKDAATGTRTYGVRLGKEKLREMLAKWVIPGEAIGFAAFAAILSLSIWWFGLFALAYGLYTAYKIRVIDQAPFPRTLEARLTISLDDFAVLWFPFFPMALLIDLDPWFLLLPLFHSLLFRNGPTETWRSWSKWTPRQRIKWSAFAFGIFLFAQGTYAHLRGDFSTSFVFPLYTYAPPPGQAMAVTQYRLFLHSQADSLEIRPQEIFHDLPTSPLHTLVRENMGQQFQQQNHAADWRDFLTQRVRETFPEGSFHRLTVQWTRHSVPGPNTPTPPPVQFLNPYHLDLGAERRPHE